MSNIFQENSFTAPLILSLTIGLAPFFPEPHLFGKIRWFLGGGANMEYLDYFDLLLHGSPWLWLLISLLKWVNFKMINFKK